MTLRILAATLATATALSIATPAAAVTVPIDYTLSVTDLGKTASLGTMVLNYDGSAYSLQSLVVAPFKGSSGGDVTSHVTLSLVPGTSDYCLYSLASCGIVPQKDSLYFIFDPSLTTQTTTLYVYSTKDLATESAALTIAAIPEPGTWSLMLLGFGSIGATIRWRRRRSVRLAA